MQKFVGLYSVAIGILLLKWQHEENMSRGIVPGGEVLLPSILIFILNLEAINVNTKFWKVSFFLIRGNLSL